jgi:hypothetical protein
MLALLAVLGLPLISRANVPAGQVTCAGNLRQLTLAWSLYSADSGGKLVNNFGLAETMSTVAAKTYRTWAHNILDWSVNPSNTNLALLSASKIFPYVPSSGLAFKCPADNFLSAVQTRAGWARRIRSYSMNGFMGRLSEGTDPTGRGESALVTGYRQFLLQSSIPKPNETIVFVDEHPDSINDGYFINDPAPTAQWLDFPGSQHNGACGASFADGSAEIHSWTSDRTKLPVRFGFTTPPSLTPEARVDRQWLSSRLTVRPTTLGISALPGNQVHLIWSAFPTNYVLQTSPSLSNANWTTVITQPVRNVGQSSVITDVPTGRAFFRLVGP